MYLFTTPELSLSPKCCICRRVDKPIRTLSFTYFIGSLRPEPVTRGWGGWRDWLTAVHTSVFNCAVTRNHKIECKYASVHAVSVGAGPRTDRIPAELLTLIRGGIEQAECYKYVGMGGSRTQSKFWCSQRLRASSHKKTSTPRSHENFRQRPRHTEPRRCIAWNGSLAVSVRRSGFLTVTVRHDLVHELPIALVPLTAKDKERVIALFEIGCAPYQILDTVREENQEPYKYSDVWNAWKSHWDQQYKYDSNPVISVTNFVKKSKKF